MTNDSDVESVAKGLGLTVVSVTQGRVELMKPTGGKIVIFLSEKTAIVNSTPFTSDTQADALYWAAQWYAHCR